MINKKKNIEDNYLIILRQLLRETCLFSKFIINWNIIKKLMENKKFLIF